MQLSYEARQSSIASWVRRLVGIEDRLRNRGPGAQFALQCRSLVVYGVFLSQSLFGASGPVNAEPAVPSFRTIESRGGQPVPEGDPSLVAARRRQQWEAKLPVGLRGRVMDSSTGRAIAGATAVAVWTAQTQSGPFCFFTDAAATDSQGSYGMASWDRSFRNVMRMHDKHLDLMAYAPGYELDQVDTLNGTVSLRPFKGTAELRIRELLYFSNEHRLCQQVFSSENLTNDQHFIQMFSAMAAEAHAIAVTDGLEANAQDLALEAGYAAVDLDKPVRRTNSGRFLNINPRDSYPIPPHQP